eukprot:s1523_g7.t1
MGQDSAEKDAGAYRLCQLYQLTSWLSGEATAVCCHSRARGMRFSPCIQNPPASSTFGTGIPGPPTAGAKGPQTVARR